MDFQKLVDVYEELENTPSGNKMREILSEFFKKVPKEDLPTLTYLTLGQISSDYEGVVLGMAEKTALKAISIAGGVDSSKVRRLIKEKGDAGLVAEEIIKHKSQTLIPLKKLTMHDLFNGLHKIAEASGSGSQDVRINTLASMLQRSSSKGAKYLVRIALGTLRMGVGDMTVLDSLAIAFTGEKKNKEFLERAFNICPDVGVIAELIANKGLKGVDNVEIKVGRPIKMMMGQRVKELEEVQKKIPGPLTIEAKYDGERIQAHKDSKGKINLFSRRLDNITKQFPDLVEYLDKAIQQKEFIVEGEVVAVDKEGHNLPFQVLMQRRRKYDVEEYVKKIPIHFNVFDLLYLNGKSYLHEAYYKRADKLESIVHKNKEVKLTERIITEDLEEVDAFFHKMLDEGYEGIFIKSRAEDSEYQAGVRGWNWIKWKKEYVKEMVDTFDLVIVGAFYGKGKRHGVYGALLCASYNESEDTFETVCKLGTGLTDEVLEDLPKKLKKYQVPKKTARLSIKKEMTPDVWFSPNIVVEVLAAEITKSPFHTCAGGLALRFPRFLQFRENKKAEQSNTSKELRDLFEK
ncbi:ATP-dependent DNA ligase [Candidatus Woesearchaeota archaeon]|jgi:DNA ligase 1|nr:ATP-dependent DNA ligase [Candidatus Woesearchaeota archaeon]